MEKLLLTVWEAADVLSVSRSRVYELLYAEQPVWTGAGYCDPDTGVMPVCVGGGGDDAGDVVMGSEPHDVDRSGIRVGVEMVEGLAPGGPR